MPGFLAFDALVDDAHRLISECLCESGCPSCLNSPEPAATSTSRSCTAPLPRSWAVCSPPRDGRLPTSRRVSRIASSRRAVCACTSPRRAPASRSLLVHGWPQHWYQWRGLTPRAGPDLPRDLPGPARLRLVRRAAAGYENPTPRRRRDPAARRARSRPRQPRRPRLGRLHRLLLAARHPERFRKVVALSTPHPWIEITPRLALETWRAWYAVLFAAGLAERTPKLAALVIRREGVAPEPYVARLHEPARAQPPHGSIAPTCARCAPR